MKKAILFNVFYTVHVHSRRMLLSYHKECCLVTATGNVASNNQMGCCLVTSVENVPWQQSHLLISSCSGHTTVTIETQP